MNPLTHAAAAGVETGWLAGLVTLSFLVTFAGWTWWALRPSMREQMDAWARLPLDDTDGGTP